MVCLRAKSIFLGSRCANCFACTFVFKPADSCHLRLSIAFIAATAFRPLSILITGSNVMLSVVIKVMVIRFFFLLLNVHMVYFLIVSGSPGLDPEWQPAWRSGVSRCGFIQVTAAVQIMAAITIKSQNFTWFIPILPPF